MHYPTPGRSRLLLFLAAFLFSTGGVAIKVCTLTAWQVSSFRSAIAAVTLLLLMPEARPPWTWRTMAASVAYAATMVSFVVATKLTTSANAAFLQSTAPLYMLIFGPLLLKERIRPADIVVFGAVASGALLLLYGSGSAPASGSATNPALLNQRLGNAVAIFSGFAWACTLTSLRWLGKHENAGGAPIATAALGNLVASIASLPLALPIHHAGPADLAVIVYLGVFQIGLAYAFLTRSIRCVPGLEAATLLLIEPVFNPVWTWLVRRERPGPLELAGGAIIVLAAFAGVWWKSMAEKRTRVPA